MHFNIFAVILCFLKEKTNKSNFLWHRRDRQYASNNERCIIHYKFIFITPPASIQINLKTLSSICSSTPNIYLILTHWWAPGETQELMTTRMYSSLFRGGGRGESNLSNYYTGPMFRKNDASSGTTRCWSKASCIDITNAQLQSQLMQLRQKKPEKIGGLPRLTLTAIPMQGSNQFASASHVTGSWSLNLFVLYPGKMKMKWQIHEFPILEPRNEEKNARLFLLKTQRMPAKSSAPVS